MWGEIRGGVEEAPQRSLSQTAISSGSLEGPLVRQSKALGAVQLESPNPVIPGLQLGYMPLWKLVRREGIEPSTY